MESTSHLLLSSEIAVQVWTHFAQPMDQKSNFITLPDLLSHWWRQAKGNTLHDWLLVCLPASIPWHIWKARNKVRFDNVTFQAENITRDITTHIHDMYNAHKLCLEGGKYSVFLSCFSNLNTVANNKANCFLVRWLSPHPGWTRLNADGASPGNPGRAGCGGVLEPNMVYLWEGLASSLS